MYLKNAQNGALPLPPCKMPVWVLSIVLLLHLSAILYSNTQEPVAGQRLANKRKHELCFSTATPRLRRSSEVGNPDSAVCKAASSG